MRSIIASTILFVAIALPCRGQDETPNFFFNLGYGSEAAFSPVTIILNDAFDVLQLDNWDRRFDSHDYRTGWRTLKRSVAHPFRTVSRYGYGDFVKTELLPLSSRGLGGGQWLPNYELHFVGGGMLFAMTTEWYRKHGFNRPGLWAAGTAIIERVVNETVENGDFDGYSADNVADIYIFDLGGILFFSSPRMQRFFSRRLNLRAWPLQPSIGLNQFSLENAGSYFSIKWRIPGSNSWHLFYYFGMNSMLGATHKWDNGTALSFGGGLHSRRLVVLDETTNRKTADLTGTAGLFLDRNGSLMASVIWSGLHNRRWVANVYPGILPGGSLSPGAWLQFTREGRPVFGVALRWVPGVSIGS